ncbi:hypothetical protein HanIR_Chr10g0484261 [Helianthus annuus]|nr:hypothetical protein HanIR_Chr10g0484261 [Helianthus annuus]
MPGTLLFKYFVKSFDRQEGACPASRAYRIHCHLLITFVFGIILTSIIFRSLIRWRCYKYLCQ